MTTLSVKPAFSMAVFISSRADGEKQTDERQHDTWSRDGFLYVMVSHTFAVLLYIRGKSSLIPHIRSILAILLLDDTSQGLVELRPHTQGITEGFSPYRKYHELLHSQPVTSMGPPVDHIKSLNEGTDKVEWEIAFGFMGLEKTALVHMDSQELGGPGLCFLPDLQYDGTGGHLSLLHQLCISPVILQE